MVYLIFEMLRSSVVYDALSFHTDIRQCTDLFCIKCFTELPAKPLPKILIGRYTAPSVVIICQIKKIRKRQLLKTEISDVYDPKTSYTVLISSTHLLLYHRKIRGIYPLI